MSLLAESELLIIFAGVMYAFTKATAYAAGCGAVGLAHLHGVQGVVCSSQITPTNK
jgi:hypothetical protein